MRMPSRAFSALPSSSLRQPVVADILGPTDRFIGAEAGRARAERAEYLVDRTGVRSDALRSEGHVDVLRGRALVQGTMASDSTDRCAPGAELICLLALARVGARSARGQGECRTTSAVTLPSAVRSSPVRPWVAIAMSDAEMRWA